ncbi:helix-turn-helix domain containing protein [Streptomonospora nanhaiensis]|uniref:Helix-turn-helix domain containing protein n=2 Tax=Nocardiopsidaceae TaxID=83676 RepID=A0ABY6YLP6_9ACTN|nr:TetR/AcrR family transcriptional regulator [Streptomonospora nanhaiensis]WAE73125.1 helix-turn-helix domain containing protein [Streptomonospora nanhaiensis]
MSGPGPRRRTLPMAGAARPERADAARNRQALLAAARELHAEHGTEGLTLEAVAARAGTGVGTVYRRFGDLAGLTHAMVDSQEYEFQRGFLEGPPPLGPGAPPLERLHAFADAFVDRLEAQAELLAVAETASPRARYRSGAYAAHHAHLVSLVAELRPDADHAYLADALLTPLEAALHVHQRQERGMSEERVRAGVHGVVDRIARP